MSEQHCVSDLFCGIMADVMAYVAREHGDESMRRLFFEFYNHLFIFLDREHGAKAVDAYWRHLADHHLGALEQAIREKGFAGMATFWRDVATEEGAEFDMNLSEDAFELVTRHCPPTQWFKDKGLGVYSRYSCHCEALYRRVAERCGYDLAYQPPDDEAGTCCRLRFTRREKQ